MRRKKLNEYCSSKKVSSLKKQSDFVFEELSCGIYYVAEDNHQKFNMYVNAKEIFEIFNSRWRVVIAYDNGRAVSNFKL